MSSRGVRYAAAALSGLLQVLCFPRFSILYLAPIALVPLLLAVVAARDARERFLLGWVSGMAFWGGACYWIYDVMHGYAGLAGPAAAAIFTAFFIAKGLHSAAFAALSGPLLKRPWALPAVAALWVAIEGTHQYLGFTWLLLGNAGVSMAALARLAPFTGVHGLSFLFVMMNVAVALLIWRRPRRESAALLVLPLLFLLPALPEGEEGDRVVRLVQPNVHPDEMIRGWTAERGRQHLERMLELSTRQAEQIDPAPAELLIWPEYSVPAYYFDSEVSREFMEQVARESGAHFIFNTMAFEDTHDGRRPLNSAVTLDPQGRFISRYAKIFRVPFGEFVPWPFSAFVDKITLAAGDFLPGEDVAVAQLGEHGVGTFICYESVFARGVRLFVAGGAEVLVNISNDSWYGRSAARHQHLLIARMRAIENGRYLIRATNDGITTVINRAGQITAPLPSFEQGVIVSRYAYSDKLTWFARFGEWFWYVSLLAAAAFLFLGRRDIIESAGRD